MIASDRQKFIEIVLGFAELKGKQLSAPALELYWRAMQGWSIEEFQEAAEELLRTCEFMPIPKDFEDLRKAGRDTAGEAWARVIGWCASGAYRDRVMGDPVIDRAVAALGGYRSIAMHEEEKLHFLERRFAEHFEAMQDAEDTRHAVPQIAFDPNAGIGALLSRHGARQPGLHHVTDANRERMPRRLPAIDPCPPREEPEDAHADLGF